MELRDFQAFGEPGAIVYLADCVDLMKIIPSGSVDVVFADPPYRLSRGGVTVKSGKLAPVDKGAWDRSMGFAEDHRFNVRWLKEACRILKPEGTIWVTGTHHIIFSLGFALQSMRLKLIKEKANFNTLDCEDSAFFEQATFEVEVDFRRATFGRGLYCRGANFERYVNLYQSKIGVLSLGRTLPFGENSRVYLRECQFDRFGGSSKVAKGMAGRQKPEEFSRDPYLQLEKYYRGVGKELEAKRLHYMGRRDLRENAKDKNGGTEWPLLTTWGDWWLKWLTGYGVHTWLLLIPIFFFLGVGTWVFWPPEALVTPPGTHGQSNEGQEANAIYLASTVSSQEQSQVGLGQHLFDRASYSLDLFLPVVNLHIDENWQPNGLGRQIYAVVHSMVGWILVPLLLASLTGIVRRE